MGETSFILIVEPEADHAEAVADELRAQGHACSIAQTVDDALDSIRARRPDVIIADQDLAAANGKDLLEESKQLAPEAEIVLLSAVDSPTPQFDMPVYGRLVRPADTDTVQKLVTEAADQAKRNRELRVLREQADRRVEFEGIITVNTAMANVLRKLKKIANSKLTVLILGESGTGKELVARAIHKHSPRHDKPYRAINCAGLNENLLESELFGHVKGAFTGAVAERKGLFEVVDGGTLFLDEVGDMPLPMQAKLLRTLENGEILPVGSNEIRKVDVRVIAATRQDVRGMVEEGKFRDDLFYRLNQASIRIPPLRERREDIPVLVEHFLKEAAETHGKQIESISPEALRRLSAHQWPGNIRELRSTIDMMVVLAEGDRLDTDDLPENIRGSTEIVLAGVPTTAGLTMEQMERAHIASTLKLTGGNREKTAKMLGIGARTLYRKLREYGLQ